jgi:hypothetical protein
MNAGRRTHTGYEDAGRALDGCAGVDPGRQNRPAALASVSCAASAYPSLPRETESQFVERARELSQDLPRLRALREKLEASVAMDGARFAKHFETALRTAWQAWCERSQ